MDWACFISLVVGIIGTAIAIYQTAVINESKKRRGELQFLLAGVNSSAIQKMQLWNNQISLRKPESEMDIELIRVFVRARDGFAEIANLTIALEGAIDSETSAISKILDKGIENVRKNNELQAEGLKNPTLRQASPKN